MNKLTRYSSFDEMKASKADAPANPSQSTNQAEFLDLIAALKSKQHLYKKARKGKEGNTKQNGK